MWARLFPSGPVSIIDHKKQSISHNITMNSLSEFHISENGSSKKSSYNSEVAERIESFDGMIKGKNK